MSAHRGASPAARAPWCGLAVLAILVLLLGTAGCGRGRTGESALSFEELTDTTGMTKGDPILSALEPYRITGDAIRVKGNVRLPDGTRLQVSVVRVSDGQTVAAVQTTVADGVFDSVPMMSPRGPLPVDLYRFVVFTHFNEAWQPPEVLRVTEYGRRIHGPGVMRGTGGQPAFFLAEERRL